MGYIRVVHVAILLSFVACWGQVTKKLHDVSLRTSPLRLSGAVSVVDDSSKSIRSYQVEGHFDNVSSKDIALIVVHFVNDEANGPSLSLTYQEDYLFRNLLERQGSDSFHSAVVNLKFAASETFQHGLMERSSVPTASAEAVFVQFADGTTWGDSQSALGALFQRKQTLQELARLERVLADAGEQALVNEFSSKSDHLLPCIRSLFDRCTNGSPSCLADGLRSVVETAKQREIDMESVSRPDMDGRRRVAQAFDLAGISNIVGAPSSRSLRGWDTMVPIPCWFLTRGLLNHCISKSGRPQAARLVSS
jgi:hypothetical protein